MIKVEVSLEGGSVEKAINDTLLSATQEAIAKELEEYRCPDHDQPIERVVLTGGHRRGEFIEGIQMRISACCERATEDACKLLDLDDPETE